MKIINRLFLPLLALFSFTAANATELHVLAAASLTDALQQIAPAYEKASGDKLTFNFAGSNILARQLQNGAPGDVFISADDAQMNALEKAELINAKSRTALLSNMLVIIVPATSSTVIKSAKDLENADIKKIALAQPEAVPAGVYAKEYLTKIGVWEKVKEKVIPTENVRAALAAVASDNVDAGIVYRTDALISKKVKIALAISAVDGPKIDYPAAVVTSSKSQIEAAKFLTYLHSKEAAVVFEKLGFIISE
ncbi:MAG: molybdate ABC transporter substrate-binding protein [Chthoniobacterales bacterium]